MDARQKKALAQRLILANHNIQITEKQATLEIIGSTGKVYQVKVDAFPCCSCLDYKMRQLTCKHIYFALSKVLRQPEAVWKQGTNFTIEQVHAFLDAAEALKVVSSTSSALVESVKSVSTVARRSIIDQNECPICLCDFEEAKEEIVFCYNACGINLHKTCFIRMKKDQCPLCRSEMKIQRQKAVKRKRE